MGASSSSQAAKIRQQNLDEQYAKSRSNELMQDGTLSWTSEITAEYLKLNGFPNLANHCLESRIDGECLAETEEKTLLDWLQLSSTINSENKTNEETEKFLKLRSIILLSPLVQTYLQAGHSVSKEKEEKEIETRQSDVNDVAKLKSDNTQSNQSMLNAFHLKSSHSKQGTSPSLSRDWLTQPKLCRRYYGAPILLLPIPNLTKDAKLSLIDLIALVLFRSVALSAFQDKTQRTIWPRTYGSKRVNPSSGGLHANEVYIWRNDTGKSRIVLSHYLPKEHAFEERLSIQTTTTSEAQNLIPENFVLIGISTVQFRQIWKYGIRGLRYTHLDLGHIFGSLLLSFQSLQSAGVANFKIVSFIDAREGSVCNESKQCLAFAQQEQDPRETETPQFFILLQINKNENGQNSTTTTTKQEEESQFNLISLIHSLSAIVKSNQDQIKGVRNRCFQPDQSEHQSKEEKQKEEKEEAKETTNNNNNDNNNNNKETIVRAEHKRWHWVDLAEECVESMRSKSTNPLFSFGSMETLFPKILKLDPLKLYQSIRSRRSALTFTATKTIPLKSFFNVLECIVEGRKSPIDQIQLGMWVNRVDGLEKGMYLLAGDSEIAQKFALGNWHFVSEEKFANEFNSLKGLLLKSNTPPTSTTTTSKDEDQTKIASELSCAQGIARDCAVTFVMFVKTNSLISENYFQKHWIAGLIGQVIYVSTLYQDLSCCGMGCFLDREGGDEFFGVEESKNWNSLYHMAMGFSESDIRFNTYTYADRMTSFKK